MMEKKSWGLLLGLSVVWGSYYLFSQRLVEAVTSFPSGLIIRVLTLFILLILAAARGRLGELKPPPMRMMWVMVLIGVLGFLLDFTAFLGLRNGSVGGGTVLLKTDVLMATLIGALVFRERFDWRDVGAIAMMFCGALLTMDVLHMRLSGTDDLFFVLSAFFVTVNAFVIQWAMRHPTMPVKGMTVAFYNNFYAMIMFGIAVLVSGTGGFLPNVVNDGKTLAVALLAGLGQSFVYVLYYTALKQQPVWLVKVFLLLMPVFTTLVETVIHLVETGTVGMTLSRLLGMALVLSGAVVLLSKKRLSKR